MTPNMYTVDAFTSELFRGSTCAVCIFDKWPHDHVLLNIAKQNGFAETAFIVHLANDQPELRWFTVSQEVVFCGYGTISAGFVYLNFIKPNSTHVTFATRSYGELPVSRDNDIYNIQVPAKKPLHAIQDVAVFDAIGAMKPKEMITSERGDLLMAFESEADVRAVKPNFDRLMPIGHYGYALTAKGTQSDYVFRYFSPRMTGVWEDPVNGASQSVLIPYWSEKLGQQKLHGRAVSQRGGDVFGQMLDHHRVIIGGKVALYATSRLHVNGL